MMGKKITKGPVKSLFCIRVPAARPTAGDVCAFLILPVYLDTEGRSFPMHSRSA